MTDATICTDCKRPLATKEDEEAHNTGECGCDHARSLCWRTWNGACLPVSLYDPKSEPIREGFKRLRDLIAKFKEPAEVDPELRALAQKAIASAEARKDEDIDAWAERLAEDMVRAGEIEYAPECPLCPHPLKLHYYDDGGGTVFKAHHESRYCMGEGCRCTVPASTGCPTCFEPYSEIASARAMLCSDSFHNARG